MTELEHLMEQHAPYPQILDDLVKATTYKADWYFRLSHINRGQGSEGLTLRIQITNPDSYHPDKTRTVNHYMIVPAAAYDERSWRRWLFEQIALVERHEACEFFRINGERPFAPSHGPGNDPYLLRELGTEADVRTSYLGELNPQ